ncbi:MAG: transcription antitermination factor NusB [Fimbriimonadaceae bacterium]|nr:transcription antitermination factor NusB [Fimbriimonadaceae bacterium]
MPVKSRRKAREAALRAMYAIEIGKIALPEAMMEMQEHLELDRELIFFAEELVRGFQEGKSEIDTIVSDHLSSYNMQRLAAVDRNLLRLGAYELLHCPQVPPAVTLNEYIEIAKKYSTAESGKFVNGVLAQILKGSPKADWAGSPAEKEAVEEAPPEVEAPVAIEEVRPGTPEADELMKIGLWKIKSDELTPDPEVVEPVLGEDKVEDQPE